MPDKMRMYSKGTTTVFTIVMFFLCSHTCACSWAGQKKISKKAIKRQQKVLLVGLDGWRWDFVEKHKEKLPNILSLQKQGVTAGYAQNVLPTNTFPNFYSIVTGLYPEQHGIIDNQMYDTKQKKKFSMKTTDSKWWNEAEPIWVTNQAQGFKSGLCYWPGYNVKIKGRYPSYVQSKEQINQAIEGKPISHNKRIDLSLKWLNKSNVTFVAVYFEDIDEAIHGSGDAKVRNAMTTLDKTFDYLKQKLDTLSLGHNVNVLVIGDHGGKNVSYKKIIRLKDYIDMRAQAIAGIGKTFVSIYPKPGHLDKIYKALKDAHPNMTVYRKQELPHHMHIKDNNRTAPLVLLADPGWVIDSDFEPKQYFEGKFYKGEHGYSNLNRDMNPGFFAFGPCFKSGLKIEKIRTIDLYPLMCYIIGLHPQNSAGSLQNVIGLLNNKCLK